MDEGVTQTLYVCREVNLYKIPARPGAGGHKSGEWQVADKIFTGRLRVTATGPDCELRIEDSNSGDLFATCPVPQGQREQAVEPVSDSSRYFVLRLVDQTTKRHAFIGMGFIDRSEAFDFNVAMSDHDKHIQRAKESAAAAKVAAASGGNAAATQLKSDAASLYTSRDLSLKEGETIKINVKRPSASGSFMSAQMGSTFPPRATASAMPFLQPPSAVGLQQASAAPTATATATATPADDLLGLGSTGIHKNGTQWQSNVSQQQDGGQPPAPQDNWATF